MRKIMSFAVVLMMGTALFTSCAALSDDGSLFTSYTKPVSATSNPVGKKVGTASYSNVLGLVATGDGGIQKAAKDGGIKKISHVDQKRTGFLGLFTSTKTFVYGD